MIKFTFFRLPKPRQFEYRPRFYDPDKDAREERRKEILGDRAESPIDKSRPGDYIRRNMGTRRRIEASHEHNKSMRTKPLRFVIMLVLIGLMLWWILS